MALYVKFECKTCENENCYGHSLPATEKVCDGYKHTDTNADRIRSMSDEELAKHLCCQWNECKNLNLECDKCLLDWLREEISE